MKKKKGEVTEIVCVLDKSGSMSSVKDDAIGGFNSFLEQQKKLPGDAKLTLVLFNHHYEMKIDGAKLADVSPLNERTYVPEGNTALLDAVGRAVTDVVNRINKAPDDEKPDKVIVMILTDGQENSSSDYTNEKIKSLIEKQQKESSWDFVFLAANQDAFSTGGRLGVCGASTMSYAGTGVGTQSAYQCMANYVTRSRSGQVRGFAAPVAVPAAAQAAPKSKKGKKKP